MAIHIRPHSDTDTSKEDLVETASTILNSLIVDRSNLSQGIASRETEELFRQFKEQGIQSVQDAVDAAARAVDSQRSVAALLNFAKQWIGRGEVFDRIVDFAIRLNSDRCYVWLALDTDDEEGEQAELDLLKIAARINANEPYLSVQIVDSGDYPIPDNYDVLIQGGHRVGEQG